MSIVIADVGICLDDSLCCCFQMTGRRFYKNWILSRYSKMENINQQYWSRDDNPCCSSFFLSSQQITRLWLKEFTCTQNFQDKSLSVLTRGVLHKLLFIFISPPLSNYPELESRSWGVLWLIPPSLFRFCAREKFLPWDFFQRSLTCHLQGWTKQKILSAVAFGSLQSFHKTKHTLLYSLR